MSSEHPTPITDEFMRSALTTTSEYTMVVLTRTPIYDRERYGLVLWEHGRRNFTLRADGQLAIVCPVDDGSPISGFGVFTTDVDETRRLMDADPAVVAGIFSYEVHPCRSFAGDALP